MWWEWCWGWEWMDGRFRCGHGYRSYYLIGFPMGCLSCDHRHDPNHAHYPNHPMSYPIHSSMSYPIHSWTNYPNHPMNHPMNHPTHPPSSFPSEAESAPHPPQISNIATHNYFHSLLRHSRADTAAMASPATPHIPHFSPPPPPAASAIAVARLDYAASYSANPA